MIILEIRQMRKSKEGELPTFDAEGKYNVVQQQFFLNEDEEKVDKLQKEINEYFKNEGYENEYIAHRLIGW